MVGHEALVVGGVSDAWVCRGSAERYSHRRSGKPAEDKRRNRRIGMFAPVKTSKKTGEYPGG